MKNEPGNATRLKFETEGSQDNAATRGAPMHVAREVLSEVSTALEGGRGVPLSRERGIVVGITQREVAQHCSRPASDRSSTHACR